MSKRDCKYDIRNQLKIVNRIIVVNRSDEDLSTNQSIIQVI